MKITTEFLKPIKDAIRGEAVLDLCGGISRYGSLLSELYERIDIYDLAPSFGKIPLKKQGRLIEANLKDIGENLGYAEYDCIFGNWALCYIGYQEVQVALAAAYSALKPGGVLILKEPILEDYEESPRLCSSGQWMLTRPAFELEHQLLKNFIICRHKDLR